MADVIGIPMQAAELVARLRAIQEAHRWTDEEFAKRCGISLSMWTVVKDGRVRLGHRSLGPILRNFPELEREVVAYLKADREPDADKEPQVLA